ncbi:MAG: GNAT family N-acetyltransferase [Anaerolineales bacterium]
MHIARVPLVRNAVAELLYVERATLGDSDYTVDEALQALRSPAHLCLGAYEGDALAGFVSCFETYTPTGARLELDMLGVLPAQRHRGIATALITRALEEARTAGVSAARAVVREDNAASLAAFRRAGLPPRWLAAMMIWNPDGAPAPAALDPAPLTRTELAVRGKPYLGATHWQNAHASALALPVSTLAYRGCWLEELAGDSPTARAALATAVARATLHRPLDEVGLLVPSNLTADLALLSELGWQDVGHYAVLG